MFNYKTWWDKNKEWTSELPKNEFAECVCATSAWVAVATTERFVRIFTIGGAQLHLVSIPGPVVTISSNQEQLFYTYHRAQGFEGSQLLSCGILSMEKTEARSIPSQVALSPNSKLIWAGFTDEGTPATYDSDGIVRIGANYWTEPVYEKMCRFL